MNTQNWLKNNKAIVIAAIVGITIIIVATLLRPPRLYHKTRTRTKGITCPRPRLVPRRRHDPYMSEPRRNPTCAARALPSRAVNSVTQTGTFAGASL